jgi:hypothetical protein
MAEMAMELKALLGGFPSAGVLSRSRRLISSGVDDGGDGISADMLAGQLINQKMWVVYQLIDGDVW